MKIGQLLKEKRQIFSFEFFPPKTDEGETPPPQCFAHTNELIEFIRSGYDFCIAAAAFPEGHLESPSLEMDTKYLGLKASAGAAFFFPQLFFDNRLYFALLDRAAQAGIERPIIPGIMPITSADQVERFTSLCGATIPQDLRDRLHGIKNDADAVMELGIERATRQCRELLLKGAPGIHFYTLNRSSATRTILKRLKAR